MKMKKVLSVLLSMCIALSMLAGMQIVSNAYSITYDTQGDCSLILAIHGGAWIAGSKDGSENTDIPD